MNRQDQIRRIVGTLEHLTQGQLLWIERTTGLFASPMDFQEIQSDYFPKVVLEDFGDTLRIHHAFSVEPFSKDKFEYALEQLLKLRGVEANLASKGNPGHDITITDERVSLKTQADKNIKVQKIWISKFMELGAGNWTDDPLQLNGLRDQFLHHLKGYERIFTLRNLRKGSEWTYELVEIPLDIFRSCIDGVLEMKTDSVQMPKPGYCRISDSCGLVYAMYFDGGTERKLQIQHLRKDVCRVHATWSFSVPEIV